MKSCTVFHLEQKIEFGKFRSSFGRIKDTSTVVEREYTPDITRHIVFVYQLTGLYKRFY